MKDPTNPKGTIMSDVNITTETSEAPSEKLVVEAKIDKQTLVVAGVAALAGAAAATGAVLYARRNRDAEITVISASEFLEGETID